MHRRAKPHWLRAIKDFLPPPEQFVPLKPHLNRPSQTDSSPRDTIPPPSPARPAKSRVVSDG